MTHERTMTDIERIAIFAAQLATKTDDRDRVELFQNAVIETGGDWIDPAIEGLPDSYLFGVSLYGLTAHARTAAQAVNCWAQWAKMAIDNHAKVGAAELVVLHQLKDCSDAVLREAAQTVRLHSRDRRALDAARRVEMMLQAKGEAA